MPKVLTQEQVDQFARDGFVGPIDILTPEEVGHYRAALEAYEARLGGAPLTAELNRKVPVREPWAAELARHPRALDAIEDLLGPDLLLYTNTLFTKEAGSDQVTGWHQDATYLGLRPRGSVNAWIALSDASQEAGCLRFLPGSPALGQLPHAARSVQGSVNHGGQRITTDLPLDRIVSVPLKAGQMSIHHALAVHSSGANRSADRRLGFALVMMPAGLVHEGSRRMPATLVRGQDSSGHFDPEPDPRDHDEATNARHHAEYYKRYRDGYEEQIARHAQAAVEAG